MQNKEFVEAVIEGLKAALPDKEIMYNEVRKNNGVVLHGVIIKEKENVLCPTIYLDRFFANANSSNIIKEVVREIVDLYNQEKVHGIDVDLNIFKDYSNVQNRVFTCLVNTKKNQEMLCTVPHREFLDLSIVYKILVRNDIENRIATVLIHNGLMAHLGVTEQELYEQAMKNTPLLFKPTAMDILDIVDIFGKDIKDLCGEINDFVKGEKGNMIVCTNNSNKDGANVLLNKQFILDTMRKYNIKGII